MSGAAWVWPPVAAQSSSAPVAVTTDDVTNVSSVPGATATVALDQLSTTDGITNASIVTGATASDALTLLETQIIALDTAIKNAGSYPYIAVPTAPNAFDDEFSSGSPDLAVRGYTVINAGTGVVQTRSGDINPWSVAGPAANTYWSTIVGSWIYIQAPVGIQIDVYKTIVLAAGDTFVARTVGSYCFAPAALGRYNEVGVYAASGALLDGNNRVYSSIRDDPTVPYIQTDVGRITGGGFSGTGGRYMIGGHDIRGVFYDTGTAYTVFMIDSNNGQPKAIAVTGAPASASLVRFGVRNLFSNSGGAVPQIWGIDFIRRKTGRAWLIP